MIHVLGSDWCWSGCAMGTKEWIVGVALCLLLGVVGGLMGLISP